MPTENRIPAPAAVPPAPAPSEPKAPNPPHGGSWVRQPDGSLLPATKPAEQE